MLIIYPPTYASGSLLNAHTNQFSKPEPVQVQQTKTDSLCSSFSPQRTVRFKQKKGTSAEHFLTPPNSSASSKKGTSSKAVSHLRLKRNSHLGGKHKRSIVKDKQAKRKAVFRHKK